MGDMADYYSELSWDEYESGHGGWQAYYRRGGITCRACNKTRLRWGKVHNRNYHWQLEDFDGSLHVCDFTDAMPDLDTAT